MFAASSVSVAPGSRDTAVPRALAVALAEARAADVPLDFSVRDAAGVRDADAEGAGERERAALALTLDEPHALETADGDARAVAVPSPARPPDAEELAVAAAEAERNAVGVKEAEASPDAVASSLGCAETEAGCEIVAAALGEGAPDALEVTERVPRALPVDEWEALALVELPALTLCAPLSVMVGEDDAESDPVALSLGG